MAELTPEQREAFVRVFVLDETCEDVATSTGLSVGTIKSRILRARRRLIEILDPRNLALAA